MRLERWSSNSQGRLLSNALTMDRCCASALPVDVDAAAAAGADDVFFSFSSRRSSRYSSWCLLSNSLRKSLVLYVGTPLPPLDNDVSQILQETRVNQLR